MQKSASAVPGLLLALGSATSFGFNIAFARLASFSGVSGSTLVFFRVFIMMAVVAVAALLLRRSLRVDGRDWGALVVFGIGTTLVGVCYLSAVAYIPVTVAVVIFYTFPILIVLASPFVEGTRLNGPLLGIALLATIGVVLVVGPAFQGLDPRGLLLAAGASLGAATQFFSGARCRRTGILAKVFWVQLMVLPASAVIGLISGELGGVGMLALAPLAVALHIGGYVAGFGLQLMALARTAPVVAGIAFCVEPLVAALTSTLVLGERLDPVQLLGGVLVIAAIVANVVMESRRGAGEPAVAQT